MSGRGRSVSHSATCGWKGILDKGTRLRAMNPCLAFAGQWGIGDVAWEGTAPEGCAIKDPHAAKPETLDEVNE